MALAVGPHLCAGQPRPAENRRSAENRLDSAISACSRQIACFGQLGVGRANRRGPAQLGAEQTNRRGPAQRKERARPMAGLFLWWRVRDSNPRMLSSLIYSQIPLAAWVTRQAHPSDLYRRPETRVLIVLSTALSQKSTLRIDPVKARNARFAGLSQQRTFGTTGRRGDVHRPVECSFPPMRRGRCTLTHEL